MQNRELTVKGVGKVSVAPDLIVLVMKLETTETEYEQTMRCASAHIDALSAAIVSAGHDSKKLKTTDYHIGMKHEEYKETDTWEKRFIGYSCTHELSLEFDFDMEKLDITIGAIAMCEANPNFDVKFSVKDHDAVSEQLLEKAIENATWKATVLARAANVNLGAIQRIDYNWGELHLYSETKVVSGKIRRPNIRETIGMGSVIEPENVKLSDTATIVWAIE